MAAIIPIIATTISNSIRENPRWGLGEHISSKRRWAPVVIEIRIEVLVGAYPRREGLCGSDGLFTSAGRLPRRTAEAIIHTAKPFATSF